METLKQNKVTRSRFSNKLLIVILSILVIINITIAFSRHLYNGSWPMYFLPGSHHLAHRVIMIYHSLAGPFLGIVTLLFLEVFEIREIVIKPIKYTVTLGSLCIGVGATFWAYTDIFLLHNVFVGGLVLLLISALLLIYGLIPGIEVKNNDYYKEMPKIGGINFLHLTALIVVVSMVVFAVFGALAAIIMLQQNEPFFLIENVYLDRITEKELFEELSSFHMRLMTALFLTGILTLIFRYTEVKGKAANIGLWLLLIGTIAMTAGYFLMIVMGKAANAILMPARSFILFTGAIIALFAWNQVSKEELGSEYGNASWKTKTSAVLKNPLRFAMYIPFFLAGLVGVIPGLIIVTDLSAYRDISNWTVERTFATGHPHLLVTLAAIVVFCLIIHDMIPKNRIRKFMGWSLITSLFITFPIAGFYFLRTPNILALETALRHTMLSGLLLLYINLLIYLGLVVYNAVSKREKFSENIIPLILK